MSSAQDWMWLASGLGFGAVNSGELLAAFPDGPGAVYENLGSGQMDEILTQKQAERLASSRPADFALQLAHAETRGIVALGYDDPRYPAMMRSISNPPLLLFVQGDLSLMNGQLSVGMVGARRPSAYGVECVKAIGRGLALGGAIIVSGLAAGLDAEAHKAALAVNGPTIACIAFGHDHCYPSGNRSLMELIGRYGAVVSEYPPATKPEKPFFLHRNRLISGLSHALVVAEARRHSGTMSTANFASEYGRDVFAVPGSVFSELSGGTNAMIRDGAYLAGSAADVLALYGIDPPAEDVEQAAARQAAEGRPAPAGSTPPWRESITPRRETREMRRPAAPAGEQTLLEALQSQLEPGENGRVSRGEALDAFRRLQGSLPGDDARDSGLAERAAAVSDSVEFTSRRGSEARPESSEARKNRLYGETAPTSGRVKPFQWDQVEHLSREQAHRASARRTGQTPRSAGPVGRVEAVPPVEPLPRRVERITAPTRAELARPAAEAEGPAYIIPEAAAPAAQAPQAPQAAPAAAPRVVRAADTAPAAEPPPRRRRSSGLGSLLGGGTPAPKSEPAAGSLAGKLRTLPGSAEPRPERSGRPATQAHWEAPVLAPVEPPAPPEPPLDPDRPLADPPPPAPLPRPTAPGEAPEEAPATEAAPAPEAKPAKRAKPKKEPEEGRAEDARLAGLSDAARRAFAQLGAKPLPLAALCEKSGLSSGEAMAALTELELAGLSQQLAGRKFVIVQ